MAKKKKYQYLVTVERNTDECKALKHTDYHQLDYPLDSKENIKRFLKEINPKGIAHLVHLVILFIFELKEPV